MVIKALDYDEHQILMEVSSEVENTKRITACAKEPETLRWLQSLRPGSTVWDVGASTGPYTLVAASLGLEVVAFEPFPASYLRLLENLLLNPSLQKRVTPLNVALSERTGWAPFGIRNLYPGTAEHPGVGQDGWPVCCFQGEDLIGPPWSVEIPTAVKIDTDGHEDAVLRGMSGMLRHIHTVLVEVEDELPASRRAQQILEKAGYHLQSSHRHGTGRISNLIYGR